MKNSSTRNIALSGLFIAIGLILPFLTGQVPAIGSRLLPMHLPVIICGFVCGWPYGLLTGLVLPLLRSVLFGSPPLYPIALAMCFELAAYGFFSGLLFKIFPKKPINIFVVLISSMILGRIVWGLASAILFNLGGSVFTIKLFIAGAFINAVPGIIIQIIIIPIIIIALRKARLLNED